VQATRHHGNNIMVKTPWQKHHQADNNTTATSWQRRHANSTTKRITTPLGGQQYYAGN